MKNNTMYIFTSKKCQPCLQLKKTIQDNNEYIKCKIVYIDIDENLELAAKMKIKTLPTIFYNEKKIEGNVSFNVLKLKLNIN